MTLRVYTFKALCYPPPDSGDMYKQFSLFNLKRDLI